MAAKIKFGLIVGLFGLVLTMAVSFLVGVCGPFVGLVAGAVAGLLTVRAERPANRNAGASQGTQAGAIAGGLTLAGQLIGNIGGLMLLQASQVELPFGEMPQTSAEETAFWIGGIGVVVCFGLLGLGLGVLGGASAGYFATPESPAAGGEPPQSPYPPMS